MKIKIVRIILLIGIFVNLNLNYKYPIYEKFSYEGFKLDQPKLVQAIYIILLIVIFISLTITIKDPFYSLVYNIFLTFFVFGQAIYDIYNSTNISILYSIVLLLLLFLDWFKFYKVYKVKKIDIDNKYSYIIIICLSIILIFPFLSNLSNISLKNLLLIDVYDTRGSIDNSSNIIGYLISPISRVIYPFLLVYFIHNKRYLMSSVIFILILLMFLLNGAIKSIMFGAIVCLFFYIFKYKGKNTLYLVVLYIISLISIFLYKVFGIYKIADYLRRVFFTPANLFNVYQKYFENNFTHFTHSRISKIFNVNSFEGSLPKYIGENVIGTKNLVANVGIFVEGYLSFGIIGFIISSILFVLFIYVIRSLSLDNRYFGMLFVYIYIINTSFIETLLITHGLIVFIIICWFIIPNKKRNEE